MVEGGAAEIGEDVIVDALMFAHQAAQPLIDLQEKLRAAVGKPKREFVPPVEGSGDRRARWRRSRTRRSKRRWPSATSTSATRRSTRPARETKAALARGRSPIAAPRSVRRSNRRRRSTCASWCSTPAAASTAARPPTSDRSPARSGVLPRTHGSSLFTRGETQALVTTTLGTSQDAQHIEALTGNIDKRFMLHYNFPPFSTGETKPLRGASRREIGPRQPGRARDRARAAEREGLPLHRPHRLGDPRVERQLVDGVGLRRHPVADGRRRSDQDAGGRASRWASSRKATASPSCPTSWATRTTWATWTSRSAGPSRASPPSRWTSRSRG